MAKPVSREFLANLRHTIEDGMILQRQGKLAEAEKIYTRILKTLPDQFETLQLLAELKMQRGKPGEAFRHMTAAVAARPSSADARIHLGHVLRALKRDADALASFDKALALDPGNVDALGNRGDVLLALQRPAEALDCFDADPRRVAAATRGAGQPRRRARDARPPRGGARRFRRGARRRARIRSALYNRGLALAALGRSRRGGRGLRPRARHDAEPRRRRWRSRGVALQALNRHDDALASFDRALALAARFRRRAFQRVAGAARGRRLCARPGRVRMALEARRRRRVRQEFAPAAVARRDTARRTRPSCCMPSRGSATPSSSRATSPCWRAPAPRSCWRCIRSSRRCCRGCRGVRGRDRARRAAAGP